MCAPGKSDGSHLSLASRFPRFLAAGIISQDNVLCIILISTESVGTEEGKSGGVQVWQESISKHGSCTEHQCGMSNQAVVEVVVDRL